jgi:hypothetical protein
MRRRWLLVPLVLLGACGLLYLLRYFPASRTLETNYAKWQAQGIGDYRYTFEVGCCPCWYGHTKPVLIEVRAGLTVAMSYVDGAEPIDDRGWEFFGRYGTIESVFTDARARIAERPYQLSIDYDERLGYLRKLDTDRLAWASDTTFCYEIRDFEPL